MKEMLLSSVLMDENITALSERDLNSINKFLDDQYMNFNMKDVVEFIKGKEKCFKENCKRESVLLYALNSDINNPDVVKYLNTIKELQEMEEKILDRFNKKKVDVDSDVSRDFAQCEIIKDNVSKLLDIKRKGIEQDENGEYWVTGPFERYGTTATVKLKDLPEAERRKYEAYIK